MSISSSSTRLVIRFPATAVFRNSQPYPAILVKQTEVDQRLFRSQAPQPGLSVAQPALRHRPARRLDAPSDMILAIVHGDARKEDQRFIRNCELDEESSPGSAHRGRYIHAPVSTRRRTRGSAVVRADRNHRMIDNDPAVPGAVQNNLAGVAAIALK